MNIKHIKEILRLFEDSSLCALDVQEGEDKISLRRKPAEQTVQTRNENPMPAAVPVPAPLQRVDEGPDFNRILEVPSPVVGVYYEAPEPGGQPFVKVGDRVQRGDILCLIEVMKQVTEVTAPQNGQVADICVTNGSVVEYGQTLVKLC